MSIFQTKTPRVLHNALLRVPQREGYDEIAKYYSNPVTVSDEIGVVLPVGSGKTGLIALTPFAVRANRVLIIAPGLRIAEQLRQAFDKTSPDMFYRRFSVVDDLSQLEPADISGSDDTNVHDLLEANVVIANIQQLQGGSNSWLEQLPQDFFDLVINDEAHHNVASSWDNVRNAFPKAKVINFSATPDRADGRRMAGKIIYSFPIFQAIADGYIKRISGVMLNPRTLRYVRRSGGQEVVVDLEEVKRLGQVDADFRRSIVSSSESLATIVDASINELEDLRRRTKNPRHKIIAAALNMEHCIQITEAFRTRGVRCDYVHSKLGSKANEKILRRLRDDDIDAVVQVRMLGEGFDHPYFSVASVLSIFSNLSPFVQFIGRIMRSVDPEPSSENNVGTVVFHAGGNIASVWSEFQDFSKADQDFFDQLLPTRELFVEDDATSTRVEPVRRTWYEPRIEITTQEDVGLETIPLFANDAEAQDAIQLLISKGVTLDEFKRASELLRPIAITKQKQRRAARIALDSRIKTLAARLISENGLSPEGRELDSKRLGRSNFVIVKSAIDQACNKRVEKTPRSRAQFSQQDLDKIETELHDIVSGVAEELF